MTKGHQLIGLPARRIAPSSPCPMFPNLVSVMRRRDFVRLCCGLALGWSSLGRAQQPTPPVVGFLHSGSPELFSDAVAAFRQGLREAGYIEGKNVTIEFRWAYNQFDRLPAMAAEFVSRDVAVIFAAGGAYPPRAAKAATSTIPVVFAFGDDPVRHDLVSSWSRPGGNVTGVTTFSGELASKRLELLTQLVPDATTVAYICDPRAVTAEWQTGNVLTTGRELGLKVMILEIRNANGIDAAFARMAEAQASALFVGPYPIFIANRKKILTLAAQYKIPAMYSDRLYTREGGLMSYGASFVNNYREGALYVARILKGAKPADLPVQQAIKWDLVINLKTIKQLGLTVPRILLAAADELID